jgi:type I restriction enzyme S subunit
LIESDNKFHINQNVAKISLENVNAKLAVYWLTSSFIRKLIERNNMSGMQPVVLIGDIRKLPIPRMSFEEQILITDYLDVQLDRFNKIIDHAQQAMNLMQERSTALISAAISGKIDVRHWRYPTEVPKSGSSLAVIDA